MNMLRNLAISRRLWMILAIALSLLILAAVLLLRQTHEQMYAGKSEKTRHVVETALGILQHYQKLELAGTLDTIPYEVLTNVSERVKRVYYFE